jgi:hypothetical protein
VFDDECGVLRRMKWFYIILAAAAVIIVALATAKLTGAIQHRTLQMIIAGAMTVLFVALIKFLTKLRD